VWTLLDAEFAVHVIPGAAWTLPSAPSPHAPRSGGWGAASGLGKAGAHFWRGTQGHCSLREEPQGARQRPWRPPEVSSACG